MISGDTAGAAREVAELGDPTQAAISPPLAAEIYGLEILADDVEDEDHNTTRFVVLSRDLVEAPAGNGPVVTSFIFNVRNLPAALYKALGGFATNGVNMTKLESYMVGGEFTATQFLAEVDGHPDDAGLQARARGAGVLHHRREDPRGLPADAFRGWFACGPSGPHRRPRLRPASTSTAPPHRRPRGRLRRRQDARAGRRRSCARCTRSTPTAPCSPPGCRRRRSTSCAAALPDAVVDLVARAVDARPAARAARHGRRRRAPAPPTRPVAAEAALTVRVHGAGVDRDRRRRRRRPAPAARRPRPARRRRLPGRRRRHGGRAALASSAGSPACRSSRCPTSVGYGASLGGLAALLAMLNSCAPGVTVVNIDNGYGAGVHAARVARQSAPR